MINTSQIVIVVIGIVVPAAFLLFVIAMTRRGREFGRLDGLFAAIARLHKELHDAFASDKERSSSNRQ